MFTAGRWNWLGSIACLSLCVACVSNPKAGPAPAAAPEERTVTPTASMSVPSPVAMDEGPPLRPETADGLTVPAAEGFVQYFFATLNYLKTTGDGSAVTKAADPGCRVCNAMLTTYRKASGSNGAVVGDYVWRDVVVSSAKLTDAATAEVTVTARQGAYRIKPAPSAPIQRVKPEEFSLRLTLSARGGQWTMFDFTRENDQ